MEHLTLKRILVEVRPTAPVLDDEDI